MPFKMCYNIKCIILILGDNISLFSKKKKTPSTVNYMNKWLRSAVPHVVFESDTSHPHPVCVHRMVINYYWTQVFTNSVTCYRFSVCMFCDFDTFKNLKMPMISIFSKWIQETAMIFFSLNDAKSRINSYTCTKRL